MPETVANRQGVPTWYVHHLIKARFPVCAGRVECRTACIGTVTGEVPNGRPGWEVYFSFDAMTTLHS
ncbi:hypothetical protein [Nitrobacter winogradskyi]|uniref:Uncharacterized protein n=2 Tax=Nitrobacter winogradskyi TaxID=913 RepID=A0ACC6AG78_NITWI|nr:hypothetical protein [Nitrobacter winogradskyi]MCP1997870.1 hypothetical protein [Nitrobacter winogradskyi]GEC17548.1 hypothetical protein NWI01_34400 [Nitrobacter winogradskyi]